MFQQLKTEKILKKKICDSWFVLAGWWAEQDANFWIKFGNSGYSDKLREFPKQLGPVSRPPCIVRIKEIRVEEL